MKRTREVQLIAHIKGAEWAFNHSVERYLKRQTAFRSTHFDYEYSQPMGRMWHTHAHTCVGQPGHAALCNSMAQWEATYVYLIASALSMRQHQMQTGHEPRQPKQHYSCSQSGDNAVCGVATTPANWAAWRPQRVRASSWQNEVIKSDSRSLMQQRGWWW